MWQKWYNKLGVYGEQIFRFERLIKVRRLKSNLEQIKSKFIYKKTGKMKKKFTFKGKTKEVKLLRSSGNYNFEKHKAKYREKHRKQNFWLRVFVSIAVIVGLIVFLNTSLFDVEKIKVEGNKYFEAEQIVNMANAKTGGNIFWGSDKREIKSRLSDNPYIEDVDVSMDLPRTLIITVKERIQKAYIKTGKKYIVMDGEGVVLNETKTKPKLTEILDIKIKNAEEGEKIEPVEQRNFDKLLAVIGMMKENNIHFKKLKITQGTLYAYVYENLLCTGKYKEVVENIENGNVGKVLVKLNKENITRGTISIGNEDYISFSPI